MKSASAFARIYRFTPARIQFALDSMELELAQAGPGLESVRAHQRPAAPQAGVVLELAARWPGNRGDVIYGGEARRLDAELDRVLGALDASFALSVRAYGAGSPEGLAAAEASERLFPHGVAHVIRLPYAEAAMQVTRLLADVDDDPALAASLADLGAARLLERLRAVHARYLRALRQGTSRPPDFADVRDARRALHERFCGVVSLIVGLGTLAEPESVEARALLRARQVVAEHNRALSLVHRRRRRGGKGRQEEAADDEAPAEQPDEGAVDPPKPVPSRTPTRPAWPRVLAPPGASRAERATPLRWGLGRRRAPRSVPP
ncbi:MAG: hypothetical protein R3F62_22745 [Planctomycetota bacterium]